MSQSLPTAAPHPISRDDRIDPSSQGHIAATPTALLTPAVPNSGQSDATSFRMLIETARNPLAIWTPPHFTEPHVTTLKKSGKVTITEVALAQPDLIRHVLENQSGRYGTFPGSMHCHDLILSEGMAANQPLVQSMAQFSSQALGSFFAAMETEASLLADKLSASPLDAPVPLDALISDVIGRMIKNTLLAQVSEAASSAVMQALDESIKATGTLDALKYLGAPDWLPQLSAKANQSNQTRLRRAVLQLVGTRRQQSGEARQGKMPDLISALLQAFRTDAGDNRHDEQITGMVIAILSTCYATSQRTLVWALSLLACAPEIQQRCADEARAVLADTTPLGSRIEQAQLIKSVISETLRLYPPVPVMRRKVLADDINHDLALARGSTVLIAPWVLHRHHALWQNPHSFIPDRFLGEAGSKIAPYSFLPFGGGEQTCIGFGYMMQATRLVVLALINQLSVQLPEGHSLPVPVQRVGLLPQSPVSLIFRKRGTTSH